MPSPWAWSEFAARLHLCINCGTALPACLCTMLFVKNKRPWLPGRFNVPNTSELKIQGIYLNPPNGEVFTSVEKKCLFRRTITRSTETIIKELNDVLSDAGLATQKNHEVDDIIRSVNRTLEEMQRDSPRTRERIDNILHDIDSIVDDLLQPPFARVMSMIRKYPSVDLRPDALADDLTRAELRCVLRSLGTTRPRETKSVLVALRMAYVPRSVRRIVQEAKYHEISWRTLAQTYTVSEMRQAVEFIDTFWEWLCDGRERARAEIQLAMI